MFLYLNIHFFKVRIRIAAQHMSKRVAEISLPESVQQARGIYSPRAFLSSRAPLLISPYKSPTRSSADEFSHILFHLIIF